MKTLFALLTATAASALAAAPVVGQPVGSAATIPTAQAAEPFVSGVAQEAVRVLADKLEDTYLYPDKGLAYGAMLRANLAAGKYSSFATQKAFAAAVTADLEAVWPDTHLALRVVPPEARSGPGSERNTAVAHENTIEQSGWITDGVAYLNLRAMSGTDTTLNALRTFIATHAGAKELIID